MISKPLLIMKLVMLLWLTLVGEIQFLDYMYIIPDEEKNPDNIHSGSTEFSDIYLARFDNFENFKNSIGPEMLDDPEIRDLYNKYGAEVYTEAEDKSINIDYIDDVYLRYKRANWNGEWDSMIDNYVKVQLGGPAAEGVKMGIQLDPIGQDAINLSQFDGYTAASISDVRKSLLGIGLWSKPLH